MNLGCSSSRAVSWIDLSGADGDAMDRNNGLSALDHNGQPLWDMPGVFGTLAGVAWISGRRFLIGTGDLIRYIPELPGINARMPAPLDTLGGTLTFYRRNANGTLTVLDQLRYGGPGQPGAPPAGTSLKRSAGWVWNLDPQAQNFFNDWTATDAACFAYPRFYVAQLLVTCSDGGTGGQYVQLGSNSTAPFLDPLLHLRLYGAGGTLLADVAQPFGAAAGESLGTWLLGGPTFAPTPGAGADGAFPVALDPAGGRIELVAQLAGVPPVLEDSVAYGPSRPPPPDGFAFRRLAAFGAPTSIVPQPRNSAGQAVQIPDCAFAPPPPRYYLREVALQCEDGGTQGQFVEIAWDHLADPLDARYHLRAFDRDGRQQFDIPRVLGWRTAGYMSVTGQFLVQSADYPPTPHLSPDGLLPAPLDTLAGRLELAFAGANGDSVASTLAWGAPPLARPLPGTSLASDGVHAAPAAEPNPVNYDGRSLRLLGCHYGGPPHGFVVGELVADCADGSPDGLFVELQSTAANEYRDPTLGLRVVPAAGAAVSAFPLFPVGQPSWPAGSLWLVGGPAFAARNGLAPDAALSAPVAAAGGRVEIFHRNPVTLADSVLAALPLAGVPLRPGHAYVRGPGGQYTITLPAMPQRFDGAQVPTPGCYAVPRGDAVAIAELMLRCRDGDAGGQFVRLAATDPDAVYSPDLVVRVRDAHGALLGERTHPYGAVEGQPWRTGTSFLVGAPALRTSLGVTPDATLPATLDTTGGTLQLVLREPDGDHLVDSLVYGAQGYAPPPAGGSLARGAGGFATSALPTLSGLAGPLAADLGCAGVCPARQVRLALGTEQVLEQPSADITSFQSRVGFDAAAGTLALTSGYNQVLATLPDRYRVVGGPPDSAFAFTARLLIAATVSESCYFQGHCAAPGVNVALSAQGVGDSAALVRDSTFALAVPVVAGAGTAFDLTVTCRMAGYLSPPVTGALQGRLEFAGLPPGARVVSCYGYDSRAARAVGDPQLTATPREVAIAWPVRTPAGFTATVERRAAGEDWAALEARTPDADGWLRVVDRGVLALHHYAYRLTWSDVFGLQASDSLAVDVPRPFVFRLLGVRPNPVRDGALAVSLELPAAGEVSVDVLDVAGRAVVRHQRWLPAGPALVPLARAGELPPGLYLVRLRAAGREAHATAVVLR